MHFLFGTFGTFVILISRLVLTAARYLNFRESKLLSAKTYDVREDINIFEAKKFYLTFGSDSGFSATKGSTIIFQGKQSDFCLAS